MGAQVHLRAVQIDQILFGTSSCVGTCTINAEDKDHPNKLPFSGVLLLVDSASNKPPTGAQGHRIYVPKDVAKRRLKTLIGMALNYDTNLEGHNVRHKVGVITGAWLDDNKVMFRGHVWKKDFPEAVGDLKTRGLGCSMELADVLVRNKDENVWHLEDFKFSGATALLKGSAAYHQTALAAAAAKRRAKGEIEMGKDLKKKDAPAAGGNPTLRAEAIIKGIAASVAPAVGEAMAPVVEALKSLTESQGKLLTAVQGLQSTQVALGVDAIAAAGESADDDAEETDVAAAGEDSDVDAADDEEKEDDEDSEDDDDEVSEDEMDAEEDDVAAEEDDVAAALAKLSPQKAAGEQEPGRANAGAKNKGRKTSVSASADIYAQLAPTVATLRASFSRMKKENQKLRKTNRRLSARVDEIQAQLDTAAERQERVSVPTDLRNLLRKGGYDVGEIQAAGEKISPEQMDAIFKLFPAGSLSVEDRIAYKNKAMVAGLMSDGAVARLTS